MIIFESQRLLRRFAASLVLVALLIGGCSETVIDSAKLKAPAFANAMKTLASESSISDHPFVRIAANGPAGDRRRALAVKSQREIQANDLLTWAESAFPDLFPGNQATLTWQNYQFRFYPGTQTYLAVDNSNVVWVFSPLLTGGQLVELGPLSRYSAWVSTAIERFAAARQLEQATFGPSPSDVEELVSKGFEAWLDEQLAMRPTLVDPEPLRNLKQGEPNYYRQGWIVQNLALTADDQLRQRVAFALSQYIVVSQAGGPSRPYGLLQFYKMLQENALGNYREILRETTAHPAMGWYLGNWMNRAKGACEGCAPSENYARELLQLFSLGVYRLNVDGSFVLDAQGKRIPTYSQQDVEELARALTGWRTGGDGSKPCNESDANLLCFERRMYGGPGFQGWGHDMGSKKVMGVTIPANQGAPQDLETVLDIIMNHPNTAPFVTRRLIQHLVTSDPSPAFIKRVSAVFIASKGDMKSTVKAILMDHEARNEDSPSSQSSKVGKIKESMQVATSRWRALGCRSWPLRIGNAPSWWVGPWAGTPVDWHNQPPLGAPNVFGFYSPDHRTGSVGLIAPEQTLLEPSEFQRGFGDNWFRSKSELAAVGCSIDGLIAALEGSEDSFLQLVNDRFFKGYMSHALLRKAREIAALTNSLSLNDRGGFLLSALLMSPEYRSMR